MHFGSAFGTNGESGGGRMVKNLENWGDIFNWWSLPIYLKISINHWNKQRWLRSFVVVNPVAIWNMSYIFDKLHKIDEHTCRRLSVVKLLGEIFMYSGLQKKTSLFQCQLLENQLWFLYLLIYKSYWYMSWKT